MREERDASVQTVKTIDQPFGPGGNLVRRFAIRTAVPDHAPARALFANVAGKLTLIVAIGPFREIRFNLGRSAKPGQFTGPAGALQRAGQHAGEPDVPEPGLESACFFLTVGGQGQVRAASVLARQRLLSFTVPDDEKPKRHMLTPYARQTTRYGCAVETRNPAPRHSSCRLPLTENIIGSPASSVDSAIRLS